MGEGVRGMGGGGRGNHLNITYECQFDEEHILLFFTENVGFFRFLFFLRFFGFFRLVSKDIFSRFRIFQKI